MRPDRNLTGQIDCRDRLSVLHGRVLDEIYKDPKVGEDLVVSTVRRHCMKVKTLRRRQIHSCVTFQFKFLDFVMSCVFFLKNKPPTPQMVFINPNHHNNPGIYHYEPNWDGCSFDENACLCRAC